MGFEESRGYDFDLNHLREFLGGQFSENQYPVGFEGDEKCYVNFLSDTEPRVANGRIPRSGKYDRKVHVRFHPRISHRELTSKNCERKEILG